MKSCNETQQSSINVLWKTKVMKFGNVAIVCDRGLRQG
jgi:hypothetical protein